MPIRLRIPCPQCGTALRRKRDGRCPDCGAPVTDHVAYVRAREERIEKVVAVVGTALVLGVLFLAGGRGLFEGIMMYAAAGAAMFYLAKKTFTPNKEHQHEKD